MGTKKNSRKNVAATRAASMNTGSTPRVSKAKAIHAKAEKPAATATATTGKKIGKASGKAKAAAGKAKLTKPAKAARAPREAGGGASEFAGKKMKVLVKPDDSGLSGNALVRYAFLVKAGSPDAALGKTYKKGNGDEATFSSRTIAKAIEAKLISLS